MESSHSALAMHASRSSSPSVEPASVTESNPPSHADLIRAKYGDAEPRQPRPNANRGDNVTGASPYQDTVGAEAVYPTL